MKKKKNIISIETYPMFLVSKYAALLALAGHFLFLILFIRFEVRPLIYFNIISCLIFIMALILNHFRFHYTVLAITLIEITAHAYTATLLLGWSSGFHIYILTLIPLIFFYRSLGVLKQSLNLVLLLAAYIALNITANSMETPLSPCTVYLHAFELMNYIIAFLVFTILSASYALAAMSLEKKLRENNIELEAISRIDPLTGLSNRRDIMDKIYLEKGKMFRNPAHCCFILADIDYFKKINDSYGHDFGDFVLVELSRLFKNSLRIQDHVCRWGGEEFLLVLPDTDTNGGVIVAEKICRLVREHTYTSNSISISLSMTFGVVEYDPKIDVDESIKKADQFLYQGKSLGRDRVEHRYKTEIL